MSNEARQAGFTMVEVIVSLALVMVVSAALMTIYFTTYKVFQYQLAFTDKQYAERAAMQMIIEDVMVARQVEYLDDGQKLRLQIDDGYVSYYLQNQTVYRHGEAKMPVANYISSLSFETDSNPGWITICMEAQQGADLNRISCAAVPRLMMGNMGIKP
jgi:type II secretory pathway pseudopilin PulG